MIVMCKKKVFEPQDGIWDQTYGQNTPFINF